MSATQVANAVALKRYYRMHARIYDTTRWSFLFGRQTIIEQASRKIKPERILEVGCGTGRNLLALAKQFPETQITGVDLSSDMLEIAETKLEPVSDRVTVIEQKYNAPLKNGNGEKEEYDLVLFSYALSMFNPGWEEAINAAKEQLSDNGVIAIVDFHNSRFDRFRSWMQVNHVKMEGHLLPKLEENFTPETNQTCKAYKGVWEYLLFIGRKKV